MTDRQLELFIRQAFALERWGENAVKISNPVLRQAILQIQELVRGRFPEESLLRERALQDLIPQMRALLEPYNVALADALAVQMVSNIQPIVDGAIANLKLARPSAGLEPTFLTGRVQDSVRYVLNTKVNDVPLRRLFNVDGQDPESVWVRQNIKIIQSEVRRGIIDGTVTDDIASSIAGPNAERRIRMQARAVARTAIQDFNRQVNEDVWDANEDVMEDMVYEYVAMFDSRTCPTCAPQDGLRRKNRDKFPIKPVVHVNCRCRIVPIDPLDDDDIRNGIQISEDKFTGEGAYKTKVKVKGQKFFRASRPVTTPNASYADYLAESNFTTQTQFFGGGNLGRARAVWFSSAVERKLLTPDRALQKLLTGPSDQRWFTSEIPPMK